MRDLEPYICVFPGCERPQDVYRTFDEWTEHMQLNHLKPVWTCAAPFHSTQTFEDPELYIQHMTQLHSDTFAPSQLSSLAHMKSRSDSQVFQICPLCCAIPEDLAKQHAVLGTKDAQDALQIHVSQHMKSLALMSLTWLDSRSSEIIDDIGDQERLLTNDEQFCVLEFEDPPSTSYKIVVAETDVDVDWHDSRPSHEQTGSDPAWLEDLDEDSEWRFCEVQYRKPRDLLHDDKLSGFVNRWLSDGENFAQKLVRVVVSSDRGALSLIKSLVSGTSSNLLTEEIFMAAATNESIGDHILRMLLPTDPERGRDFPVTERVIHNAIMNTHLSLQMLVVLLPHVHDKEMITDALIAVAKLKDAQLFNLGTRSRLLDNRKTELLNLAKAASAIEGIPLTVTPVRALFDFSPTEPGELQFRKGDLIAALKMVYQDWWDGSLGGQTGSFPVNYVEMIPYVTAEDLRHQAETEREIYSHLDHVESLLTLLDKGDTGDRATSLYQSVFGQRPPLIERPLIERQLMELIETYAQRKGNPIMHQPELQG